jgi:hypothetical protein
MAGGAAARNAERIPMKELKTVIARRELVRNCSRCSYRSKADGALSVRPKSDNPPVPTMHMPTVFRAAYSVIDTIADWGTSKMIPCAYYVPRSTSSLRPLRLLFASLL